MKRYKTEVALPNLYDSSVEEKKILRFWNKEKIFQRVRKSRSEKDILSFYSAPVFPTGSPHSGHIFNSIVKDVFTRYGHQKNLQVNSRIGWDCHGISVEYEVEKKLGIQSPTDVERMGIPKYNEECRNFVDKHIMEWRNVVERTGNWVDFDNEYHTMSREYMEKVWWVFKQLFEKGLVYNSTKVVPYSTGCFTHLSNFEAEKNCKEVIETGYTIVVAISDSSEKLLIWTTNPSSLGLNMAMCVNPKEIYVRVKVPDKRGEEVVYIASKNSLPFIFPKQSECIVVDEFPGTELKDLKYEPLFGEGNQRSDWEVLIEEFIADEIGTGIVPLDEVVVESLKRRGLLFKVEDVKYKKPFCWQSNTPLIHKRVNSWHIRVEGLVEDLLKNFSEIEWCAGDGTEFRAWLEEKRKDWTIERTRYWGTPIPVWSSPSGDEVVCVGSIEELKRLTGKTNITDIHREHVDWMVIPSRTPGNPPLRRVSEVFDCWFESGALPFVLNEQQSKEFTADFVIEGRDQTRGWFYTMLVLSTALSQPLPFRNIVSTGLVLNTDESKMTKRRHNNNDYMRLIDKYGADAFRLYLLSSPLVEGKDCEIEEKGVVRIMETVIQPLWRILKKCTSVMKSKNWVNYGYVADWDTCLLPNLLNGWILSTIEGFLKFYFDEMNSFRIKNIVPSLITLLQKIEDWYIPYQKLVNEHIFTSILFNVIFRICLTLSPFAPFITEYIYQQYRDYIIWFSRKQSIHEDIFFPPCQYVINPRVELSFSRMQAIVGLVRTLRTRHIIPNQYRISELVLIHHNAGYQSNIDLVKHLISEMVNVHELRVSESHDEFGATLEAELKNGCRLCSNQQIAAAVRELKDEAVKQLIQEGTIDILSTTVSMEDVRISYQFGKKLDLNYAVITEDALMVVIKMNKELSYYEEGAYKVVANRLMSMRRKGNYYPNDKSEFFYSTKDQCLSLLLSKHGGRLSDLCKSELQKCAYDQRVCTEEGCIEEMLGVKGHSIKLHLCVRSNAE